MNSIHTDSIIGAVMLILGLSAIGCSLGVCKDISIMSNALASPSNTVSECSEMIVDSNGNDLCADGDDYAPIDSAQYLPRIVEAK